MTESAEQLASTESDYTIIVSGGSEHGTFDIVPPVSDEHYTALMEEPRLSRPEDFYLERGESRDSFWLGHDYNNGSGYGEHYERASYFARVVAYILQVNGASVTMTSDTRFERVSNQRLYRIQQANNSVRVTE